VIGGLLVLLSEIGNRLRPYFGGGGNRQTVGGEEDQIGENFEKEEDYFLFFVTSSHTHT
jgi:hypothetical protein